jgi:hypothetical protein
MVDNVFDEGGTADFDYKEEGDGISGFVMAGFMLGASIMVLVGAFQITGGLAAILNTDFYQPIRRYSFDFSTTAWGWIHLALGLVTVITGFSLFAQKAWAVKAGIALAGLSAINNFLFIPHAPVWSILILLLDVWVIYVLTRPGIISRDPSPDY